MRRIISGIIVFCLIPLYIWAQEKYPITFSIRMPAETASVSVVGDFNNWDEARNPLQYSAEKGVWEATIELMPGQYEYRYLINGINWIKDPANPDWRGTNSNSVAYVLRPNQPELIDLIPETGSILHDEIVKIRVEYWDGIEKNEISLDKSTIKVDDRDIEYEYIPEKTEMRSYSPRLKEGEHTIRVEAADKEGNRAIPLTSHIIVNSINVKPIAEAGYTIISGINESVSLNTGYSYDPDLEPLRKFKWTMLSKPEESKADLVNKRHPYPRFVPDKAGRYVFSLEVRDEAESSAIDTVDVYAFIRREYPTEFIFPDSTFTKRYEAQVDCVSVVGEFNQWSTRANRMNDYNHDGTWSAWINLNPGEYEYKFVVNDRHWIPDPLNARKIPDGWESFNSIKEVTLNLAPHIEVKPKFRPGYIQFDASQSFSKTGKELIYYWYQDINNPERYDLNGNEKVSIPIPRKSGIYYYYLILSDSFGSSSKKTLVLKVKNQKVKIQDFSLSPDWAQDAVIYEIFVERFTKQGDLQGVIQKIPYLKELGINCIWLMPIFESPTENGYGPTNFFKIDSQYGTEEDFKSLVQVAHQAGIRVILDFIANHTSDQHRYFLSSFENSFSVFHDWYQWIESGDESLFYTYQFHNDWDRLPNLNHENPQVRKFLIDAALYWMNTGIDGYRCDVAWGVPHDFWKLFRRKIKNRNPDFLLLNETLPRNPAYHEDEFDMSYDTDFYGNMLDVFRGRKPISAIQYGIDKTKLNYPEQALSLRYLENHDMERFISQFDINSTKLAATLIFTLPGTPLMLYGQEYGLSESLPIMNWDDTEKNMHEFYQKLILLRRNYSVLRRGDLVKIPTDQEESVYAYSRMDEKEKFMIIINFSKNNLNCQLYLKNLFPELESRIYAEEMLTGDRTILNISNHICKYRINYESAVIIRL